MNYVEIVARQEELQKEMQELNQQRIEAAQSHTDVEASVECDDVKFKLSLDYASRDLKIFELVVGDSSAVRMTVDEFNAIGTHLQKYNDAIFSYMSEITKEEDKEDV